MDLLAFSQFRSIGEDTFCKNTDNFQHNYCSRRQLPRHLYDYRFSEVQIHNGAHIEWNYFGWRRNWRSFGSNNKSWRIAPDWFYDWSYFNIGIPVSNSFFIEKYWTV